MGKATIADVAREAGVSTFTVSRALRGMDHVAQETRDRVLAAAKKLGYTASKSAAALASGKTHRVALLARERIGGWFMGELLDGLYDVLRSAGYDILVFRAGNPAEREAFFRHLPTARNADALVITGFSATQEESAVLAAMGMPIVAVNSPNTSFTQGSLMVDDRAGEAAIVRYLAALGHTRLAYVGRRDPLLGPAADKPDQQRQWGFDMRIRGYRDAVEALHLQDCGHFTLDLADRESAAQTAAEILSSPVRPTAVCAWSDQYAVSLLQALLACGVRVPQEMSVFGFDGSDYAGLVGLSTLSQPARQTGRRTAEMVLDLLAGRQPAQRSVIIPTHLRPGVTSGPAPDATDADAAGGTRRS